MLFQISPKFVPKNPTDYKSVLICRTDVQPEIEYMDNIFRISKCWLSYKQLLWIIESLLT